MIKKLLKKMLRSSGLELSRHGPYSSRLARTSLQLKFLDADLVLDVGANSGQFASSLREGGYQGEILSFEPTIAAYDALTRQAARDADWFVAPRMALGATDGITKVNVSRNSWSSSLFSVTETHMHVAPASVVVAEETVDLYRLDTVAFERVSRAKSPYLKIDTQGYEKEVLAGAPEILKMITGLQCEISLVPLYEGQPEFLDLINFLKKNEFELFDLAPEFIDQDSGRLLQVDAVFVRRNWRQES